MRTNIHKLWVLMAMLWVSITSAAYDFEVDGIYYDITSFTEFTVTAISPVDANVSEITIPNKVVFNGKELKVTEVASCFAEGNSKLNSVSIDVANIGQSAFKDCMELESVSLNDSVRHIGDECFQGCVKLREVTLGENIEGVGISTFKDCKELTFFNHEGITTIGAYAFYNCQNLTEINLPQLHSIPAYTFAECSVLTKCNTPNVSYIGDHAFSNCRSINNFDLSMPLREIGSYAFEMTDLCEVVIPDNIVSIERGAFNSCKSLVSATLGRGLTSIYPIFEGCDNLTELKILDSYDELELLPGSYTINSSVSYGGEYAEAQGEQVTMCSGFFSNSPVKYVYIGRNIKQPQCSRTREEKFDRWSIYGYDGEKVNYYFNVYNSPFAGSNITKVTFGPYVSDVVMAKTYTSNDPYFYGGIQIKDYEGNGVLFDSYDDHLYGKRVECSFRIKGIFEDCQNLEEVEFIGFSVKLPEFAFQNCPNLKCITLPYLTQEIGKQAFNGCENLQDIDLGNVKTIKADAFSGCDKISSINILASTPPQYTTGFNFTIYTTTNVNVPQNYEEKYRNTSPWSNFWNITSDDSLMPWVVIDEVVYSIEDNVASIVGNIILDSKEVVLHNEIEYNSSRVNVKRILSSSFEKCPLNSIVIPGSIDFFGENVFDGCNNLNFIRFEYGEGFLAFPHASTSTITSTQTRTVNGKTVKFRIRFFDGYFNDLPIESLYLNRNLTNIPKYSISGDDEYYIESYDSPFNNLQQLINLTIGPEVSILGPEKTTIPEVDLIVSSEVFGRCDKLKTISVMAINPPMCAEFSSKAYSNATLIVPDNTVSIYKESEGWKEFLNIREENYVPVESFRIDQESVELPVDGTLQLEILIEPENATPLDITWKSSNENVVTVSELGFISGISEGTATITATMGDLTAQCEVTVIEEDGVEEILANPNREITIYSVDGTLVKKDCKVEALKTLEKGIYIIVSGKDRYKITL